MKTRSMAGVVALAGWTVVMVAACADGSNPPSTFEEPSSASPPPAAGGGAGADTGQPAQPAQPAHAESIATFSPAEVTSIVEVVNLGEVTQGRLAEQQATSPDVKAFARRMVDEHGQALERMQRLTGAQTTAVTPATRVARDPTASVMMRHQELLTSDLKTQTGTMFDLSYMTGQIEEHAKVLALIDRALLPSVSGVPVQGMKHGAHGAHPAQAGAAQTGGAGGSHEATPPAVASPPVDPAALQAELQTMRAHVASHLVEALRIQQALRTASGGAAPPAGAPRSGS